MDDDEKPNLTEQELWRYLHHDEGLPVTAHATDQFAYLRQSVRTNTAAIVPEGQVKPTSVYTVVRIEDRLDVVAHLSDPIPRLWIADNAALQQSWSPGWSTACGWRSRRW